jgi:hypothetical protein
VSDLERVGDGLDEMLRRLGIPSPGDSARLFEEWDRIAGEPWADRSEPIGVQDGELVVEVADGAVATLLRYQTAALVDRLAERLGAPLVQRVTIRVRRRKKGR